MVGDAAAAAVAADAAMEGAGIGIERLPNRRTFARGVRPQGSGLPALSESDHFSTAGAFPRTPPPARALTPPSCATTPMNPKHLHTPLSTRARCPVCHEVVYSRAGIHPQCAVRQSDPPKSKSKAPGAPVLAVPEGAEPHVIDVDVDVDVEPPIE